MLTNVAVLCFDGVAPFELGLLCEAFGLDRSDDGVPVIDFAVCGVTPGRIRTSSGGFGVDVEYGLERVFEADLVAVPAQSSAETTPVEILEALREVHAAGTRLISVCSGAFTLGEAGLLDDRECTTHWRYTDQLQSRFPRARVVPEVLYVDSGQVITSAGSAAGLDACLHLWRQEYGAATASRIARRMVVPPHRDGGQAQFIARVVPDCDADTLGPLLTWAVENLADDLSIETLAKRAHMSVRTFSRRFRDETGATPHAWVTAQRLAAAEELLESGDESVERIATRVGLGNAATLRHHFTRARGVSPQRYRQAFRAATTTAS
ncbi:helix-turn-helix domain-containing protein [Nocardioides sp. Bht2]|uniref:helix-turn-helix domain-containing protein n=1 Tax=Nocardioides sp. Bht2 TaxID=3392297 RepID=UPI0039B3E7D7